MSVESKADQTFNNGRNSNSQTLVVLIIGFVVTLTGCTSSKPVPEPNPKVPMVLSPPSRIYVAIDDSLSVGDSKIPRMKTENFQPLIQLVEKLGGEIRVGEICSNSDTRLSSFYMPEPPVAPQPPVALPKAGTVNALELPQLKKQHDTEEKTYQQQLSSYKQAMTARLHEAKRKSEEFTTKISKILKKPPSCTASDLVGMVERGNLYLSEAGNWHQPPRNIALLITDGLETVRKNPKKVEFTSKPQVLLVSSGGQSGILQSLLGSDKPYESIESAVRFITNQ
jgi:hypothetical protein